MPIITLSSKHQITLPVEMIRGLRLKSGDKLIAELIEDHIVLLPQPDDWTDHFKGSMKGVYGSTHEEIDTYIPQERTSPERWEWREQFYDKLAADDTMTRVVETLKSFKGFTAPFSELWAKLEKENLDRKNVEKALEKLTEHGGVRKMEMPQDDQFKIKYRLVRELAGDSPDS